MEDFTLDIERRSVAGSGANRRFRKTGRIPSIVYHHGEESIPTTVTENMFMRKAQVASASQIFRLKSEDKTLDGRAVIVREVQRDYSKGKGNVLHIDFQALKEDEEIRLDIALKFVGEAPGVKTDGGILSIVTHSLGILCLPKNIPSSLQVDISGLHLSQSIHAGNIPLPAGVALAGDPEETVVTVVIARTTKEDDAAAATGAAAAAAAAAVAAASKASAGAKPAPAAKKK